MKRIFILFSFLLMILGSQSGHAGFVKFPLMDKKKDGQGGSGSGKNEDENEEDNDDDSQDDDSEEDDEDEEDDSGNQENFDALPDWAKKQIKDLRKESAKHRNNFKTVSEKLSKLENKSKKPNDSQDDEEDEEEEFDSKAHQIVLDNAILELAVDKGVSKDNLDFFKFLVTKKLNSLEEGEELSEDDVEEILEKIPASKGSKGPANTSFGSNGSKGKGSKKDSEVVTEEEFASMGMIARQKLYQKNPDLYKKLMKKVGV